MYLCFTDIKDSISYKIMPATILFNNYTLYMNDMN